MILFITIVGVLFLLITPFLSQDEIIISLSKSFLIGILYDKTYLEEEKIYLYTLQFSFVFILISYLWEREA